MTRAETDDGVRISLWVGLVAVGIGPLAGMIIGLVCGSWEGRLDLLIQRVMDALMAIPGLVLALAIVSVLKPNCHRLSARPPCDGVAASRRHCPRRRDVVGRAAASR